MLALWCFELPGGDPARTDIPAALLCTLRVLGANPSPCFEFPPTTLPGWEHPLAWAVRLGLQEEVESKLRPS